MKLNMTILAAVAMGTVQATTLTWTGEGANANMSTPANWNPQQTPATGDALEFGGAAACLTPYNDLDPETVTLNGITFKADNNGEAAAYEFSGNRLVVNGKILGDQPTTAVTQTFDLEVEFTTGTTIGGTASGVSRHNFTFKKQVIGPSSGTMANSTQYSGTLRFEGDIEGFTDFYRPNGGGNIYFSGNNTAFTAGGVKFNQGNLYIIDAANLGTAACFFSGQGGYSTAGTLFIDATNDFTLATTLKTYSPSQNDAGLKLQNNTAGTMVTFAGNVQEGGTKADAGTKVVVDGVGNGTFTGSFLTDRMGFTKNGTGTWTFDAAMPQCALTGLVTVANGKLVVDTTIPAYLVKVEKDATLAGGGTLGTAASRVEFANGAKLACEVTDGGQLKALAVPGTVSCAGSVTVNLTGIGTLTPGSRVELLTFGAKEDVGSFTMGSGFPEGSVLSTSETALVLNVPSELLVWTGDVNGIWNTSDANWANGLVFSGGNQVKFPVLADEAKRTVEIPATVRPLQVQVEADAAHPYSFTGAGGVAEAAEVKFTGSGTNVWGAAIADVQSLVVEAGGLCLSGPVSRTTTTVKDGASLEIDGTYTDGSIAVEQGGSFTQGVASVIGGAARVVLRSTNLVVSATNTFTGGFTVGENVRDGGTNPKASVRVNTPNGFGCGDVTVCHNSTLDIYADVAVTNHTLTLNGYNSPSIIYVRDGHDFDWAGDVQVCYYPQGENFYLYGGGVANFGKQDGTSTFKSVHGRAVTFVVENNSAGHGVHLYANFDSVASLGFRGMIYIHSTNNVWSSFNVNTGTAIMMATNALPGNRPISMLQQWNNVQYEAKLDLNGFDQTVTMINTDYNRNVRNMAEITSAAPAVLTVSNAMDTSFNDASTFFVKGALTLRKMGGGVWTLGCQNTSSGNVEVVEGTLKIADAQSLPTGPESTLRMSAGAVLGLEAGVAAEVTYAESLTANGTARIVDAGLYGGPDCTDSSAKKVAWIVGTGTLRVRRSQNGTLILIK